MLAVSFFRLFIYYLLNFVGFNRYMVVIIIRFFCGFLVSVFIIIVCYFIIVCKLRRNRLVKIKKFFKIIVIIIITFFFCWCFYYTFYFLEFYYVVVFGFVFSLGLFLVIVIVIVNSCMNFILYVFMG